MDYSADNFSRQLNTKFTVKVESGEPVELELVEVAVRKNDSNEQVGMERFSTFFRGRQDQFLPQQTYDFHHTDLGEMQIFLVPIGLDGKGYRYEAIFNRFLDR